MMRLGGGSKQPASSDNPTAAVQELKRHAAPVLDRQDQRAWTGEHNGLCDAGDVDATLDARDRSGVFAGRSRLV